jgi:hypothetical protein
VASYQELEGRLALQERKLEFMMKLATVTKREESVLMPGEYVTKQMSLLDLYREISNAGELETFGDGN